MPPSAATFKKNYIALRSFLNTVIPERPCANHDVTSELMRRWHSELFAHQASLARKETWLMNKSVLRDLRLDLIFKHKRLTPTTKKNIFAYLRCLTKHSAFGIKVEATPAPELTVGPEDDDEDEAEEDGEGATESKGQGTGRAPSAEDMMSSVPAELMTKFFRIAERLQRDAKSGRLKPKDISFDKIFGELLSEFTEELEQSGTSVDQLRNMFKGFMGKMGGPMAAAMGGMSGAGGGGGGGAGGMVPEDRGSTAQARLRATLALRKKQKAEAEARTTPGPDGDRSV